MASSYLSPSPHDLLGEIATRWVAAVNRADAPRVAALFAEQAIFIGSQPKPLRTRAAIEDYYRNVPAGLRAAAAVIAAQGPSPDLVVGVLDVRFFVPKQDERAGVLSIAASRQAEMWLIQLYHLHWL